jgi:uracil-DNA glycosylase
MTRIFISYRRQDSEGYVGRLHDHLLKHFLPSDIFMDVASIAPGEDFVEKLESAVRACDVCLVVIGAQWATLTDESGARRLDQWNDFVRIEIETALTAGKRVIPVLVGGAKMPAPALLPESIAALARRNAVEIAHSRFAADVDAIVSVIRASLPARTIKPPADAAALRRKTEALNAVRAELINATDSPLYAYRVANTLMPVPGDGSADAGIMFIGESPGRTEAAEGRPFVGQSGKVLDELLHGIRLKRADVFITNLILDHPGKREPTAEEIAWYTPYVERLILTIEPKVIVALGRFAAHYLLRRFSLPEAGRAITALHGTALPARLSYGEIHLLPMLHPAVVLYEASKRPLLERGFDALRAFV